jgi:lipopolysaccharide transport system permease protein
MTAATTAAPPRAESEPVQDGLGPANVHVIEPRELRGWGRVRELWAYRNLFGYFGGRAVAKITNFTLLGRAWLVLRPTADTAARALVFGGVLNAPSLHVPYYLFFITGMWCWRLFDRSLFWATRGIELNRGLVRKMYFPRLLLPISSVVPGLVEFGVYTVVLVGVLVYHAVVDGHNYLALGPQLLLVPLGLLMAFTFAMGAGLITSVLGAYGRDARYSLSYLLDFWLFVTPVIYPLQSIPSQYQTIALLNPMTAVVELVKYGLINAGEVRPTALAISGVAIVALLLFGLRFFDRYESQSIDNV